MFAYFCNLLMAEFDFFFRQNQTMDELVDVLEDSLTAILHATIRVIGIAVGLLTPSSIFMLIVIYCVVSCILINWICTPPRGSPPGPCNGVLCHLRFAYRLHKSDQPLHTTFMEIGKKYGPVVT